MNSLTVYRRQPWPSDLEQPGRGRGHEARSCLANAWYYVLYNHPKLKLVKGYGARTIDGERYWVGHWWCVDEREDVVDPTWMNEGEAYVGVSQVDPLDVLDAALGIGEYADVQFGSQFHPRLEEALGVKVIASPSIVSDLEAALRSGRTGAR